MPSNKSKIPFVVWWEYLELLRDDGQHPDHYPNQNGQDMNRFIIDFCREPRSVQEIMDGLERKFAMKKEYDYRSVKKISKKGIWFDDGFFLDFEFYFDNHIVVFFHKRIFFNSHKHFQNFRFTIEEMGYTTYDLS